MIDEHQAQGAAAQRVDAVDALRGHRARGRMEPATIRAAARARRRRLRLIAAGRASRRASRRRPPFRSRRAHALSSAWSARRGVSSSASVTPSLSCSVHSPRSARSPPSLASGPEITSPSASTVDRTSPRSSGAAPTEPAMRAPRQTRRASPRRDPGVRSSSSAAAVTSPSTDPAAASPRSAARAPGRNRDVDVVQRDSIARAGRSSRAASWPRCPSASARASPPAATARHRPPMPPGFGPSPRATAPRPCHSVPSRRRAAPTWPVAAGDLAHRGVSRGRATRLRRWPRARPSRQGQARAVPRPSSGAVSARA